LRCGTPARFGAPLHADDDLGGGKPIQDGQHDDQGGTTRQMRRCDNRRKRGPTFRVK